MTTVDPADHHFVIDGDEAPNRGDPGAATVFHASGHQTRIRPQAPTVAEVRARSNVVSGDRFSLAFSKRLDSLGALFEPLPEALTHLATKYVLDGDDVLVTFYETDAFVVHDTLLRHRGRWWGNGRTGLIECTTFSASGGVGRETWRREFNAVSVAKAGGNTAGAAPFALTLRFRKVSAADHSE